MMKVSFAVMFGGFALSASVMPLLAHHSVAAEFDKSKAITIQGTVTRAEWMNPHALVWVETKNTDGTVSMWELELPPPNTLERMLRQSGEPNATSSDFLKTGDQVSATLWRAKDGSFLGHAFVMTFPDGRVFHLPGGWP